MIRIVTTTRHDEAKFQESLLGKSIGKHWPLKVVEKPSSLAEAYNAAIDEAEDPDDILVFVHDDVRWANADHVGRDIGVALELALCGPYGVVGVAGNTRRAPGQVYWFSADNKAWDMQHISGAVEHSNGVNAYGQAPQEVKLLDGLFLAVRVGALNEKSVRFDPRFKFHFYDLDFCRTCEQRGVKMTTWPIVVAHESGGAYDSAAWREGRLLYLDKWGE